MIHPCRSPFRAFAALIILSLVPTAALAAAGPPGGVTQPLVLAPGPGNPRNSEGDFVVLKGGRILFVYTHFTGGTGDAAAAHLASRASADGGRTWTDADEPVVAGEGKQNVMSVSLLRLRDGRIGLFYLVKNGPADCRARVRFSADEARSWGEPTWCTPEGSYVVNNGRAVQLSTGRIVLPTADHTSADGKAFAYRGVATCFYSDDGGATWAASRTRLQAPPASRTGLQEPLVVELKDRRLMMLCRTDQGSQFRSDSADGGQTWSDAEPTDIKSPVSPASVRRIPTTGDLLMVWNDHENVNPALRSKRTPLTAAVSTDDGKTWGRRKTLYDDPAGWYCYTTIAFVGEKQDRVLLGHCAGTQAKGSSGLARTVVTAFDVDWLYR